MMRIGSAASTSPKVKLGNVVIPNGAVRMEGTGNHYLPFEFPAVPDYEMLKALEEAAKEAWLSVQHRRDHHKRFLLYRSRAGNEAGLP